LVFRGDAHEETHFGCAILALTNSAAAQQPYVPRLILAGTGLACDGVFAPPRFTKVNYGNSRLGGEGGRHDNTDIRLCAICWREYWLCDRWRAPQRTLGVRCSSKRKSTLQPSQRLGGSLALLRFEKSRDDISDHRELSCANSTAESPAMRV
jgi:hypothetical protein